MRLWWNHLWKSSIYRHASASERRVMEIRFTVAWTLKKRRRAAHITQAELAALAGMTRNTLSRLERASNRVALDHAVRALIELGCSDDDVANAFNPALNRGVWQLRKRAQERCFPKPAKQAQPRSGEDRFYRKRPPVPRSVWQEEE